MQEKLLDKLNRLWGIKQEYKLKVFLLSSIFLLMSACLVIWKPLKYSLFSKMVGATYVPNAKILSIFILIPLILLYSKLVDWLRRHHLLYVFTLFHGAIGLIFYYFMSHPVYGLANTAAGSHRLLGWLFYFLMESFDAFFSTSFWSFADSINRPKDAKNYYGFVVCGSKIGGILASLGLYLLLKFTHTQSQFVILPNALLFGSIMLFAAAGAVYCLVRFVSEDIMHGYEKAYELETNKPLTTSTKPFSLFKFISSAFEGLLIMIKNSYVLGIFSLVVFYDVMIAIFDYLVMLQADAKHSSVGSMTAFYALYYLLMNIIGLGVSFFGTTPLLRILGIRLSLFIFPTMCFFMLIITLFFPFEWILFSALVGFRALNYALNHPTREVLYIPTTKEVKFKAKTWTDAFGSRIAKTMGSGFNLAMKTLHPTAALFSSIGLSISLTGLWLIITYFLGRTLQNAIDQDTVIGKEKKSRSA